MGSWAVGALLFAVVSTFGFTGCTSDDGPNQVNVAGSAGQSGSSGTGGSAGAGGTSGTSGSSGTGGTSGLGGSSGSGGASGNGGSTPDAGGSAGDSGNDAGGAGGNDAGGSSGDAGTDAGGSAGDDGGAGTSGTAGTAGSSGTGGTSGAGGSAGTGGTNTGGTGGDDAGVGGMGSGSSAGSGGSDACVPQALTCPVNSCGTITGNDGCGTPLSKDCGGCVGSYECKSNVCADINECAVQNGGCSQYANCLNTPGSFSCACKPDYTGDGYTCLYNKAWGCTGWARDASFDALKINGTDVKLVGGMWGSSSTDYYVTIATYTEGAVAHNQSGVWTIENLNPVPTSVGSVWGSGLNDVWIAARNYSGYLFHWNGSAWIDDPNKPTGTKQFTDVWGADASNVYLLGANASWVPKIWKKSGNSWTPMTLPAFPSVPVGISRIWGLDENHVFAPGYYDQDNDGNPDHGILLYFDGNVWTQVQVPADVVSLGEVHGTSLSDLYVTGQLSGGNGVIYHVTQGLTTWTARTNGTVVQGPAMSLQPGTVISAGTLPPAGAGQLRLTTLNQSSPINTYAVDNLAYGPMKFWAEPGTDKVHFIHISYPGVVSGHYTGNCN